MTAQVAPSNDAPAADLTDAVTVCAYLPCMNPRVTCYGLCGECWRRWCGTRQLTVQPPQPRMSHDEIAEEIRWLLDTDTPAAIARRIGFPSVVAAGRTLHRWGYHDLAQVFERRAALAA